MTALVLAGVTLLEGVRRVPAGATLAGRMLGGPWIREGETKAARIRLVSWLSPFLLHLVLPPTLTPGSPRELRRRWRLIRRRLPLLRALGVLEWLLLVLGVPLAMARWSWLGLILAVAVLFSGSLLLTILSALALDEVGLPRQEIVEQVSGLLSPFAAPRATEVVAEAALAGAAPLDALRLLLPREDYAMLLRPLAYDVQQGKLDPMLLASVPAHLVRAALKRPAGANGAAFCPRCGGTYRSQVECCDDCGGIALSQM